MTSKPARLSRRHILSAAGGLAALTRYSATSTLYQEEPRVLILPAPRRVSVTGTAGFTVDGSVTISMTDPALEPVATWLRGEVPRLASMDLRVAQDGRGAIALAIAPSHAVDLSTTGTGPAASGRVDERHALSVDADGVRVAGSTAEGVFRGATSLLHLIAANADGGQSTIPAIEIEDAPRYAWRGLSLDVVRTFHPVPTVLKVIDLLALYKMNVLHLHLTDSEGWRFEVPGYPELTSVAGQTARSGRPGGYYTQDDFAEIVAYASERFVTVVSEFDSPGHTASVLRAYPALAAPGVLATPEAMQYLHPNVPGVWDLVGTVYEEMARATPGGRLHIGGDEAIAMSQETFRRYVETALPMARATGKGIVAWQETARAGFSNGDLMQWWIPPHLIERVQQAAADPDNSWLVTSFPDPDVREAFMNLFLQAREDLPKGLLQGASVIVSRADKMYLDTKYAEPPADPTQLDHHKRVGLPVSVYGNGTVRDSYAWSAETLDSGLPADRIAGVEAAIWCETIEDEHDLMFQLLPRLPGVAEKAWSNDVDWEDYLPRIAAQRPLWDAMSLDYFVSSVVWPAG